MSIESEKEAIQNKQSLMRQEFGATEISVIAETASSAVAAQAKAMVESRYFMAIRNPRDWMKVRETLKAECMRPEFANNPSSYYIKPIGNGVEGLGIRFVELALRCMTNVLTQTTTIYDDDQKRIVNVTVTDLENNNSHSKDVTIRKTVERSRPMDDGTYLSVRLNSYKKPVYTIPATDDDLLNKENALISKAVRTQGLRLIPGDLQDEGENLIKQVRKDETAKDPNAARKAIADAFFSVGVSVERLQNEYLEHSIDVCTPEELVALRGLYGALKDGEATWKTVIENKVVTENKTKEPKAPEKSSQTGVEAAKAKIETEKPTEKVAEKPVEKVAEGSKVATTVVKPETQKAEPAKVEPQKVAEPIVEQKRITLKEVTFPLVLTSKPGDPAPSEELVAELMGQAERLNTDLNATVKKHLGVETHLLNPEAIRCLITVLKKLPTPAAAPVTEVAPKTEAAKPPTQSASEETGDPYKGGKELREVKFPLKLTRTSEDEAFTEEQLESAQTEAAKCKGIKSLSESCKRWIGVPMETLTSTAMDSLIKFLIKLQ